LSNLAIALILLSAIIHACWNLISKRSSPSAAFFLAANGIGAWIFFPWVIAYPEIIFNMPARVWTLLILTGLFQALYCICLAAAYRHGDLSVSYPITRSLPVILVPIVTILLGKGDLLGERFAAGAVLVLAGGALIAVKEIFPVANFSFIRGAVPMAILAAIGTTGYSMVDDHALRIIRSDMGTVYGTIPVTLVYGFLEALACSGWLGIFIFFGRKTPGKTRIHPGWAAATGVLMYLTYGLVLLSMAYARDVSLIVAFRQVSILVGAFLGLVFLKEAVHRWKIAGLAILFAGLILVALS
jgi:drug/metabolite transporter (DMT)-like permease